MGSTAAGFSSFLTSLKTPFKLPDGIQFINPYQEQQVQKAVKAFCRKFYAGNHKRVLILGINPGRFGGGVTGISFTDPVALEVDCGINNSFEKRRELSSRFIYEMIENFGGSADFYKQFLLSAVCPLGFIKGTTNYNYYDSISLLKTVEDFILASLEQHAHFNISNEVVISLGKKNASCLEAFNAKKKLFKNIIYLEHPRYIMQYKLKTKSHYIAEYCRVLQSVI